MVCFRVSSILGSIGSLTYTGNWYRGSTANCRFVSHKDADITIITGQDAHGLVTVMALRTENDQREVLLEQAGDTWHRAMHGLHQKSAAAVHKFITTNGVGLVSQASKKTGEGETQHKEIDEEDDKDDEESVGSRACSCSSLPAAIEDDAAASASDACSSSDAESVSDGGNNAGSKAEGKKRRRKNRHSKTKASEQPQSGKRSGSPARSRSPSITSSESCDSDYDVFPRRPSVSAGFWTKAPARLSGVPQPPGWGTVVRPHLAGPPAPAAAPTTGPGAVKPAMPTVGAGLLQDVSLLLRWKQHGEKLVLVQCPPSLTGVHNTALAWVRRHASTFINVSNFDTAPSRLSGLRAVVRSAAIEGEKYDLSGYANNDIRKLMRIAGASNIPRFEVEIDSIPSWHPSARPAGSQMPGGRAPL